MRWEEFTSLENVYKAWVDFSGNKKNKSDVINFKMNLEDEILKIHFDLVAGSYTHGSYATFTIYDPKKRVIHKATVRDRVVHRLMYNYFLPIFNRLWLDCSFSCRPGFGQHISIEKVKKAIGRVTRNYNRDFICVKCDIRKFFDNIDHHILYKLICLRIYEPKMRKLVGGIINSYKCGLGPVGIPIGNLTSQIFANIYLHELDIFAKHELKLRHYYRYADDFIFLMDTNGKAEEVVVKFRNFLADHLKMEMHPNKIIIRKASWGIDWLGKVLMNGYSLLRLSTARRMMVNIKRKVNDGATADELKPTVASYNGLLLGTARRKRDEQIRHALAFYR